MNSTPVSPSSDQDSDALLQGARACLTYLGVCPGEQIVLLPTFDFMEADPETVHVLRAAAKELGAETTVALIESLGTHGEPTEALARALDRCDMFIGIGNKTPNPITGHCRSALTARWDFGARQVDLRGGPGVLATQCSLFPAEITLAIAREVNAVLKDGAEIRIRDEDGTDFRYSVHAGEVFFGGSVDRDTFAAGQRIDWPLGQLMMHVSEGSEGSIASRCLKGMREVLDRPILGEVRDGHYRLEERAETAEINSQMAKPHNSDLVSKLFLGVNPKGSVTEGLGRSNVGNLPQSSGVVYVAVGDKAGLISSDFQTGAYIFKPDIEVNGQVICRRGRLSALDSPKVREIAAKYGDPDELLTQIP